MVNIDEFTKQSGSFLRADDVTKSPTKTFLISGDSEIVENEKFGGQRLQVPGGLDGVEKVFSCSKTNARTLVEGAGSETETWIGVTLILETYRTKVSSGEMVDAINIKEVQKVAAPVAAPVAPATAAPAPASTDTPATPTA